MLDKRREPLESGEGLSPGRLPSAMCIHCGQTASLLTVIVVRAGIEWHSRGTFGGPCATTSQGRFHRATGPVPRAPEVSWVAHAPFVAAEWKNGCGRPLHSQLSLIAQALEVTNDMKVSNGSQLLPPAVRTFLTTFPTTRPARHPLLALGWRQKLSAKRPWTLRFC